MARRRYTKEKKVLSDHDLQQMESATAALLEFCRLHGIDGPEVRSLADCLEHLKNNQPRLAWEAQTHIWLGKEGFSEHRPIHALPGETESYVYAVFHALVERWSRLIGPANDHMYHGT